MLLGAIYYVALATVIFSDLKIYMLFTGWEVRIGRNCALGLSTQDLWHSFSQYGSPSR